MKYNWFLILIMFLSSFQTLPARAEGERYSIGSWQMITDSGFCLARLSTWGHEVEIAYMDGEMFASVDFKLLSFTRKETWGYISDIELFRVSNENGLSRSPPFSDDLSNDISMVGRDGDLRAANSDVRGLMGIISTGNELIMSREVGAKSRGEWSVIMSVTHEGGDAAMSVIERCGR